LIEIGRGAISKMSARLDGSTVQYAFRLGDVEVPVNPLIGSTIRLEYLGAIHCTHCGRRTKTSFSQGYCYPCMTKLAQCDLCIMSPERCHFEAGTCRDPAWGEQFCMTDHVVYLANSSGVKVGITLKLAVEIGKWADGNKLTAEQRELSLQAMIAWEIQNLPEEERTGYMGPQECQSKSTEVPNILFKSDAIH